MIARRLAELRADHVLIVAALDGLIPALECTMPICSCPKGREYFVKVGGHPYREKWAPSPDRYPVPGRDGGTYEPTNVRLAHMTCNVAEGGRIAQAYVTSEGRARQVAWGKHIGPIVGAANLRRWRERIGEDAYRAEMARHSGFHRMTKEQRSTNGQRNVAVLKERGFFESPAWRARQSPSNFVPGMGLCTRWNINRGKPCTCGHHASH